MWHVAAKLSELEEGKGRVALVKAKEIALFRQKDKVYALDNVCPHRGGPLGEGALDGDEVICPWHAWSFDLKTGACLAAPDIRQGVYAVKIEGDEVLVDV